MLVKCHRSVQHLLPRFSWNLQGTLSVSVTNYPVNFMEIDEIDAEHCDGKLQKHFPQFLTKAVFPSNPSIYDGFNENSWNSHSLLILSRRAPEIFFRIFHPHLYPKMRLKMSKTVIKEFFKLKNTRFRPPRKEGVRPEICFGCPESYLMQLVGFQTRSLPRAPSKSN